MGAAGGLGGFFLPSLLGMLKDSFGGYGIGLLFFCLAIFGGALLLLEFGVDWRIRWTGSAQRHARIFSYRRPRDLAASFRAADGETGGAGD